MNIITKTLRLTQLKAFFIIGCYLMTSGFYLYATGKPYLNVKEKAAQISSEMHYDLVPQHKVSLFFGDELDFDLYPNPSKGGKINLEIKGIETNDLEITLYNTIGKVIERKSLSIITPFASVSLETNDKLNPGLYFVSLSASDGQKVSKKLIVIE